MSKWLQWFLVGAAAVLLSACTDNNSTKTNINSSETLQSYEKSFSYDSTNKVIQENLGDGKYIEYTYDDSGNLIAQQVVE